MASSDGASESGEALGLWFERAARGDGDALVEGFGSVRHRLELAVRLRLDPRLRGRFDAADILQEVYLDVVRRFPGYAESPDMPWYLWLRFLTVQRLKDCHRKHLGAKKRSAALEVSIEQASLAAHSASLCLEFADTTTRVSQQLMRREARDELLAALESLEPIDREVLALRHFEELTNDETAELLGLKKSAASNRYVRALTRLRQLLEKPSESESNA